MHQPARTAALLLAFAAAPLSAQVAPHTTTTEKLLAIRDIDGARKSAVAALARAPKDPASHIVMGRVHLASNEPDSAVTHFRHAVELQPTNGSAHTWLGHAHLTRAQSRDALGDLAPALAEFQAGVKAEPANVFAHRALVLFHRSVPEAVGGSFEKAWEALEGVRTLDAGVAAFEAAQLHLVQDMPPEAEDQYRVAIAAHPDSVEWRVSYASMMIGAGRHDDAYALVDEGLGRTATALPLHYQLGRLAAVTGRRLDDGERGLRAYLAAPPASPGVSHSAAWWRLGMVLERKGDVAGARGAYEQALKVDPRRREAKAALDRLGASRN